MVFSSILFLFFFLPALLLCYFCLPRRFRAWRNGVLLAFSLFFYACGGLYYLPVLLCSIAVNYLCGLLAAPGRPATRTGSRRRWSTAEQAGSTARRRRRRTG